MVIEVRPAIAFEDIRLVVGPKRADAHVCCCPSYRILSKLSLSLRGPERGAFVEELAAQDSPPGVLASEDDDVVGWVGRSEPLEADKHVTGTTACPPGWSPVCQGQDPDHDIDEFS
jgi:hypothetical protein